MKKYVSFLSVLLTIAVLVIFLPSVAFSQQVPKIDPKKIEHKIQIKLKADLRVSYIEAYHCKCEDDLKTVNAMLVADYIKVKITNAGPNKTNGKLVVTYYDMKLKREVTHNRTFTDLASGAYKSFTIAVGPKLIQKSTGIKAVVSVTSANTIDPVPDNNEKILKECWYNLI